MQIMGSDPAFLDLMDRVSQIAPLDRPVLVIGERGTGKELIASRLHFLSQRWGQNFIKLNCAALPDTLIDSELFGVEPGAFTGAVRRRAGRFEQADGGSLFLDEIATLSQAAQEKLLRIIEYGQFERLGGSETLDVDVRVVGAANVDLPQLAKGGRFRADLLDRLAFDVLTIPPLRARPDDIPLLAEHFARSMAHEMGWQIFPGFAPNAMERLCAYPWPGNVRELKNVVERAVYRWKDPDNPVGHIVFDPFSSPYRPLDHQQRTVSAGVEDRGADGADLTAPQTGSSSQMSPSLFKCPSLPYDFRKIVAEFEKRLLDDALASCRHNQRETAENLSLSYDQFRHAAKKHNLL